MATVARIHWVRIIIGGFLAEGAFLTFVLAVTVFFAPHSFFYAVPVASMLVCFLFAFWVGQRVDANFVLHGALVGVVATLIEVGLFHGRPEHWAYIAGQALKIPCGAAGGLVAGRLRGLLGTCEEKQKIVAAPNKQALAIACGLLVGAFLFQRFGFDKKGLLYGWEWYLGAVLLAGIGLAGIFTQAWLISAIGLGLGPTLVFCIEVVVLRPAESMWPIVLPMVFLFSFPVPIIGSGISQLLTRIRLPRAVYFVALTSSLVVGALLPNIQKALHQRLETKTVPGILRQIYDAELIYRARQPDGNFVCDGTLLPGAVGKLGWTPGIDPKIKNTLVVQYYTISFDCGIKSTGFRVSALSNEGYIPAPPMWIDQSGKLVVVPIPPKGPNTH